MSYHNMESLPSSRIATLTVLLFCTLLSLNLFVACSKSDDPRGVNLSEFGIKSMNWELKTEVGGSDLIPLIWSIYRDKQGYLWLGSIGNGLMKVSPGLSESKTYTTGNSGLPSDVVLDIQEDSKGNIWLATGGGLVKVKDEHFQTYNTSNVSEFFVDNLSTLAIDGFDNIWMNSGNVNGGGILKYNQQDSSWEMFTPSNSLLPISNILKVFADEESNVWVGMIGAGLWKISPNGSQEVFGEESNITYPYVDEIRQDRDYNIWIGSTAAIWLNQENFLGDLQKLKGSVFESFSPAESGNSSNAVGNILFDRMNNLWVNTLPDGAGSIEHPYVTQIFNGKDWLPLDEVLTDFPIHIGVNDWIEIEDGVLIISDSGLLKISVDYY